MPSLPVIQRDTKNGLKHASIGETYAVSVCAASIAEIGNPFLSHHVIMINTSLFTL